MKVFFAHTANAALHELQFLQALQAHENVVKCLGADGRAHKQLVKGRDACGIARLTQTLVVAQDDRAISSPTKDLGNVKVDDNTLTDDDDMKYPW